VKYLLGLDIGSSSVKAALLDAEKGKPVASAFSPASEMPMLAVKPGFAEQDPEMWWNELLNAMKDLQRQVSFKGDDIVAIGISYQMHGLVCVDDQSKPLRPSIIWCDSRAVEIGQNAFIKIGKDYSLSNFLNSPGNFTASKLKWVKENEPDLFKKIKKVMLPGDYIALKLTGQINTTVSGLSEGILWNFKKEKIAEELLEHYGIDKKLLSPLTPTFGEQGRLNKPAAQLLNLKEGTPVTYRAGDQPNNAWSLNVLQPGEVAATAGTSGVVYAVTDKVSYDTASRVNTFVHVNHLPDKPRYGVLLCINGTGILNSWLRKNFFAGLSYDEINKIANDSPIGSAGLYFYPFGNGAERVLENKDTGGFMEGLQFNQHQSSHIARAAQEGIVYSLQYGMEVFHSMGISPSVVRAGKANMFLSPLFREAFANTTGCSIELFNTDGAIGAARAAGVGVGYYSNFAESFKGMEKLMSVEPEKDKQKKYKDSYENWKEGLNKFLKNH